MALQRVETDAIEDDAITTDKIAANAVAAADIAADAITNVKVAAGASIAVSKISGLGTAATLTAGTSANNVVQLDGSGNLPAINGSNLTGVSTDTSAMENNIAILAFKTQAANNLAKFNLIDQVIDEYYDTSGIDAGNSTNEMTGGSGTAKYYEGGTTVTPTVSGNYDYTATDGDYTYYKWTTVRSDGTYTTNASQTYDFLVIAGGGSGGATASSGPGSGGGGGGAGGFRNSYASEASGGGGSSETALTFTGTISNITVGAGGVTTGATGQGNVGANSVFSTITSIGGGSGGIAANENLGGTPTDGSSGGSAGGHGAGETTVYTSSPSNATANQGYPGGVTQPTDQGAGGGGAGSIGGNGASGQVGGPGGAGLSSSITGSAVLYAGGGGGGGYSVGGTATHGGGTGGKSNVAATAGTANTGGGGGGRNRHGDSGAGGSGIVIIRRLTAAVAGGGNLTLQSVANTALSAPTTGDVVMLIENGAGTATLNTDIKAYVSRNGGGGWDQATLVDKGTWGTNKKILVANNVAFSNSASGTDMRYKITTHNQSAGSKETRIHATSLAWA